MRSIVVAANEAEFRTDGQKSKKDPAPTGVRKLAIAVAARRRRRRRPRWRRRRRSPTA